MIYLNGVNTLTKGNKMYIVEKLSAIRCTEFDVEYRSLASTFIITYHFELDFSGSIMRLHRKAYIEIYSEEEKKKGFFAKKKVNPYYEFLNKYFHIKDGFKSAYLKTDRKKGDELRLVGDYNRWFAECTGTTEELNSLTREIEYVLGYIDECRKGEKE